jgi:hypothetical protein
MRTGRLVTTVLDQAYTSEYLKLAIGSTTSRPAAPSNGMIRYNSTMSAIEYYSNSNWTPITNANVIQRSINGADGASSGPTLFTADSTRASKILSVASTCFVFAMNSINADEWILFNNQLTSTAGLIMPYAGTVIALTFAAVNAFGNRKNISVYVNDTEYPGALYANGLSISGEYKTTDTNVNIDFAAGDKLRMRARSGGSTGNGNMQNVLLTMYVKWRSAT